MVGAFHAHLAAAKHVVGFLSISKGGKGRPPVCVASLTLATQVDLLKPVPQQRAVGGQNSDG